MFAFHRGMHRMSTAPVIGELTPVPTQRTLTGRAEPFQNRAGHSRRRPIREPPVGRPDGAPPRRLELAGRWTQEGTYDPHARDTASDSRRDHSAPARAEPPAQGDVRRRAGQRPHHGWRRGYAARAYVVPVDRQRDFGQFLRRQFVGHPRRQREKEGRARDSHQQVEQFLQLAWTEQHDCAVVELGLSAGHLRRFVSTSPDQTVRRTQPPRRSTEGAWWLAPKR